MNNKRLEEAYKLIDYIVIYHSHKNVFKKAELLDIANSCGVKKNAVTFICQKAEKLKRGYYDLTTVVMNMIEDREQKEMEIEDEAFDIEPYNSDEVFENVYIPQRSQEYVKWGHAKDIEAIISSRMFYPTYITGLSGNGKTMMVEQACARLKRHYVRVQISPETDEDDLIGGFRLTKSGDVTVTSFEEGPVIRAMKAGAILLIDEIDRGTNKIMCLQGVLEGKPILIKKTGEVVRPAPGFNVIATANTKGKGSDDGRFIAACVIDEAFLERFVICMEQPYPTQVIEKRILLRHMDKNGKVDDDFAHKLTLWSDAIRKTFMDGGIDEIISTRRLCHIVQTFSIFGERMKAVELCISRFDDETKEGFRDLYTKFDPVVYPNQKKKTAEESNEDKQRNAWESVIQQMSGKAPASKFKPGYIPGTFETNLKNFQKVIKSVECIKKMRQISGLGPKEAKDAFEGTATFCFPAATDQDAETVIKELETFGLTASV